VKLGPAFVPQENEHLVQFLKSQFTSYHVNAHQQFLNRTLICSVSYVKKPVHICPAKFHANLHNLEKQGTSKET